MEILAIIEVYVNVLRRILKYFFALRYSFSLV